MTMLLQCLLYATPYFARLGNPMQDCHLGKEPDVTGLAFRPIVILSRRRRISVRIASNRSIVKYKSAGRLLYTNL